MTETIPNTMPSTIQWIAATLLTICAMDAYASDALFRCERQGQVLITDRPIDQAECQPLSVSTASRADATPVPKSTTKKPASNTYHQAETIASEQIKTQQRCDRIRLRLDEISNKMRTGYSVEQGERLKMRKRELEAAIRVERCG